MCRHQFEPHSIRYHRHYSRMAMEKQRPHKPWCLQGAPFQKGSKEETFAALAATADEEEIDAFVTVIWKPEATTPQEPEEEPEVAPEMKGDCMQLAAQISRVKQA